MRQTLFRIPLDAPWSFGPLEVPGFGWGLALALWVVFAGVWLWRFRKELRVGPEFVFPVVFWLLTAVALVKLPAFVHRESYQTIAAASAAIDAGRATPAAYLARGRAWAALHDDGKAIEDFRTASVADPMSAEAVRELAWVLATSSNHAVRDGNAALEAAHRAVERDTLKDAWTLDVLAAAQAETGEFDAAVKTAQSAARKAFDTVDPQVAARLQGIRERLSAYESHRPWRESRVGKAIPVYGYGFMLFVGFVAAGWTATRRARSVGIPGDAIWDAALWVFFSGIAGARLFYIAQYPDRVFGNRVGLSKVLAIFNLPDGGLVLYGGVLLGIVVYILYCRRNRLDAEQLADVLIPSLFLGVAFGRMGCFLNGCCYGDRCELPWAVNFPVGSVPDMAMVTRGFLSADEVLARISLHPTQIYSTIDGLILSFVTAVYFRTRPRAGAVMLLGLLCYPITRFFIEYLRSDEPPVLLHIRKFLFAGDELFQIQTPFTISQWVSVGMLVAGIGYGFWWSRRGRIPARGAVADSATHGRSPAVG